MTTPTFLPISGGVPSEHALLNSSAGSTDSRPIKGIAAIRDEWDPIRYELHHLTSKRRYRIGSPQYACCTVSVCKRARKPTPSKNPFWIPVQLVHADCSRHPFMLGHEPALGANSCLGLISFERTLESWAKTCANRRYCTELGVKIR